MAALSSPFTSKRLSDGFLRQNLIGRVPVVCSSGELHGHCGHGCATELQKEAFELMAAARDLPRKGGDRKQPSPRRMKNPQLIAFLLGHFEFARPGASLHPHYGNAFRRKDVEIALRFLLQSDCVRRTYVRDAAGAPYAAPLIELTDDGRALLSWLRGGGLLADAPETP